MMSLNIYVSNLREKRENLAREIRGTLADVNPEFLKTIGETRIFHLLQHYRSLFASETNVHPWWYSKHWPLRIQEWGFIELLLVRAVNVGNATSRLERELAWIDANAPKIGWFGGGEQYNFQSDIKKILTEISENSQLRETNRRLQQIINLGTELAEASKASEIADILREEKVPEGVARKISTVIATVNFKHAQDQEELRGKVREKDSQLHEKDEALREKTADLRVKDKALSEKDGIIKDNHDTITRLETEIQTLKGLYISQCQLIERLEKGLEKTGDRVSRLEQKEHLPESIPLLPFFHNGT